MAGRYDYSGACHCRNLELVLSSDKTPAELGLRTDTCEFCAKHRAVYTSDPAGEVTLVEHNPGLVQRYRFGTKTADFLVCMTCGVLVAAHMPDAGVAVINASVLDARALFLEQRVHVVDLDAESLEARLARRRARWTPVASGRRGVGGT